MAVLPHAAPTASVGAGCCSLRIVYATAWIAWWIFYTIRSYAARDYKFTCCVVFTISSFVSTKAAYQTSRWHS
jgi:hypothetical protein